MKSYYREERASIGLLQLKKHPQSKNPNTQVSQADISERKIKNQSDCLAKSEWSKGELILMDTITSQLGSGLLLELQRIYQTAWILKYTKIPGKAIQMLQQAFHQKLTPQNHIPRPLSYFDFKKATSQKGWRMEFTEIKLYTPRTQENFSHLLA